jgi:hypothetical protein
MICLPMDPSAYGTDGQERTSRKRMMKTGKGSNLQKLEGQGREGKGRPVIISPM